VLPEIYKLYKPLRNTLRSFATPNVFYVIWAYVNHLQFGNKFPKDIQVSLDFLNAESHPQRNLYEWELSILAREVILHGTDTIDPSTKSIQSWNNLQNAINKLKEFENNVWPVVGGEHNILVELRRLSHRQFPWQNPPNTSFFLRNYKIYSNERVTNIIESKIQMSIRVWYVVGCAILGAYFNNPKINIDPSIQIEGITSDDFNNFLKYVSADIPKIREIIKRDVKYDDQFVYYFNPLEFYPLVKIDKYYYCPITTFLAWRITSGIYFDLIKDKNFGSQFGFAFQDYLLEVATKVISRSGVTILGEEKYKVKTEEDSVDIIIADEDYAFFIESKAKRLKASSKSELLNDDSIKQDIGILADAVVQVYKTYNDYKAGLYPQLPYQERLKIYPLIITLEEWYLIGEDLNILRREVASKMEEEGLSLDYIDNLPYILCSCERFESLVQVLNKFSIKEVVSNWFVREKNGHDFGNDLIVSYKEYIKPITDYFPGDFENIFPESIFKGVGKE